MRATKQNRMLRSLLAGLVALPGILSAQDPVPALVRDALDLRIRLECREPITVERVSIRFWPAARFYVGRCEAYYGMPQTAVVALDSAGVFYLLDSPTSFELLERRIGAPQVDSADRIDYAFHVAKLADAIPWDATLQAGGEPDPDPRRLAPSFPTEGSCTPIRASWQRERQGVWTVGFDAATNWWVGHVTLTHVGNRVLIDAKVRCAAVHNP
jgi:hypothetical protein